MFIHNMVMIHTMAEILCPHCEIEIVLDDDAFGEFECPHCENEFEWGEKPKTRVETKSDSEPMSGIVALSHALHGAGALMLIIGLFVSWITIGGFLEITPFGMRVSLFGFGESVGWFSILTEGGGSMLAITGILFMILTIVAVISQIIHVAFRVMLHMVDSGSLDISMEMAYRAYHFRWHTSLIPLVCAGLGYILIMIGVLTLLGMEGGFPWPNFFTIALVGILGGQFYMINQELMNE
jgi:hypothetical protein